MCTFGIFTYFAPCYRCRILIMLRGEPRRLAYKTHEVSSGTFRFCITWGNVDAELYILRKISINTCPYIKALIIILLKNTHIMVIRTRYVIFHSIVTATYRQISLYIIRIVLYGLFLPVGLSVLCKYVLCDVCGS